MDRHNSNEVIGTHIVRMSQMGEKNSSLQYLWLPEPPEGKFWFSKELADDSITDVYFEAIQGKWYACSSSQNRFKNQHGEVCSSIEISDKCIFMIKNAGRVDVVYAEAVYPNSGVFHNYFTDNTVEIMIGRTSVNDIVYPNALVSSNHAVLKRNGNLWQIKDLGSANGVYVNGKKIFQEELHLGDVVYIMGLRIIIGVGFVSINDGNDRVMINSGKLHRVSPYEGHNMPDAVSEDGDDNELFNRLPRKRKPLNTEPIVIEAPPMSLNSNNIPLLLRMGSPLVMSSMSLMAGNITSMLSSVMFPVLTQKYTDKQRKDYEDRRNAKYNEYLHNKYLEIQAEKDAELQALEYNYPDIDRILYFTNTKERLWERRVVDDDFLSLRIGHGNYPLLVPYEAPPHGFEIDEDPLMEKMYQLAEAPVLLERAPVMVSFLEDTVCGVVGDRSIALEFIRHLIIQLSILHSYDEVKLIFLVEENELTGLEFIRYIPHIWNDQRDFRFLATNTNSGYQIGEYLKKVVEADLNRQRTLKDILRGRPYYIVFALSKRIFDSMEVLKEIMQTEQNCGVSVVAVFDDLPKECSKIFDLKTSKTHSVVSLKHIDKENEYFRLDHLDPVRYLQSMKEVANTKLKMVTQAYSLPKMVTFLEMFSAGRVEHLNPIKRWKDNNPVRSLAAPVGIATDGSLFMLDLHEKYQGPHGLVAGMTGSGKSEFIITYILSMAVNYHPDEVAFVLIDYKGGGLAGAFDDPKRGVHLPHLVGTITNLDGASIQRSMVAIQSELTRRQRIFNEVKSIANEGTMDIYTYQKLYRNRVVTEPMPHLFIISDEFAELKKQEPQFMDKLISAARIGRSLGVHLILATQKPSGVVDDQIWSNTKFRVCLRVQDRSDSLEMLKRPEAAELKDTGRFYLQVGYNEFFALGQSAWCGAKYEPQDEVVVQKDNELQIIDTVGQVIAKAKPKEIRRDSGHKQIVAIVKYLSDLAEKECISTRPLWKAELQKRICLDTLKEQYQHPKNDEVVVTVGLVDAPSRQEQFALRLNLQQSRNLLVVGESGSGKTTLIQTLLFEVVCNYTADEVNFYILDFSSRNLRMFEKLPHCGAVMTDDDESAVERLFRLIEELIEERRKLFADAGVSSFDAYKEVDRIPLVLFLIDDITRFEEMRGRSDLINKLGDIMGNGVGYGIKVIATIAQINDCPFRIRRQAGEKLALRARDRYVYTDILDCRCTHEPVDTPGRGMCVIDDMCYEFQTALSVNSVSEIERSHLLKQKIEELRKITKPGSKVRYLETMDEEQEYMDFCKNFQPERIPIGYDVETMQKVSIPLQQHYCMSIYFGNQDSAKLIMNNLLYAVKREQGELLILKRAENSMFAEGQAILEHARDCAQTILFPCDERGVNQLIEKLTAVIVQNKQYRNVFCQNHSIPDATQPNAVRQWRKYVRSQTKPVFVLLESFLDMELAIGMQTAGTLAQFFQACVGYNIYFWACSDPEDVDRLKKAQYPGGNEDIPDDEENEQTIRRKEIRHIRDGLRKTFNIDNFCLLLGGRFHLQHLLTLPPQLEKVQNPCSPENNNKLLMNYHGKIYSLSMPAGKIANASYDMDEAPII